MHYNWNLRNCCILIRCKNEIIKEIKYSLRKEWRVYKASFKKEHNVKIIVV